MHTDFGPHIFFQQVAHAEIAATVHTSYATPFCAIVVLNAQVLLSNTWHSSTQRIVTGQLQYRQETIAVASVYAPAFNPDRQSFFESFPMRAIVGSHQTILGGDWNDAPSEIDFLHPRDGRSHLWHYLEPKVIAFLLFDPLRIIRGDDVLWTRVDQARDMTITSASRIDFFLVSSSILHRCETIEIFSSISSDHDPVFLSIQLGSVEDTDDDRGLSLWRLPQPIARFTPFSQQASDFIKHTCNQVLQPERGIWVTTAYYQWVERCRNFAKVAGYKLRLHFLQAHQELHTLRHSIGSWNHSDTRLFPQYLELCRQAEHLEQSLQLTGRLIMPARLHTHANQPRHPELTTTATESHFADRFRARPLDNNVVLHRNNLLQLSTATISETTKAALDQTFTVEEFKIVITKGKKSRSASGMNGLPHVFWSSNIPTMAKVLCRVANALRSGRSLPGLHPVAAGCKQSRA
ncbi:uncharacterized protein UBRO_20900 [Ustilago bromivora]|uniref:Endonuclease/exonuclease/phosphatase domain-containing protein n=1 Tax=Ustilago bromivora TaxID=307758 RepID=A0A1K0HAL8_9BASI|nr:uncharacterized protein UBRO_20900 [Ustilago bromivora]